MIQLLYNTLNSFYLDLYDKWTNKSTIGTVRPLIGVTNLETNNTKYVIASAMEWTYKNRYIRLKIQPSTIDAPTLGIIKLGNKDNPFGLYKITIYENNTNSNTDVANVVGVLWEGLMNLKTNNNPAIAYTEYSDEQTAKVYLTNTL